MKERVVYQRDTNGWRIQVWLSFGVALVASAMGVIQLPGEQLDRAFLAIGFFFCLFAAFAVAKTLRDNRDGQVDTAGWIAVVWIAFAAAITLTAWGLWRMKIEYWMKSYMLVSWLFLVSTTFTLAKMVRDKYDSEMSRAPSADTQPAA